MTAARRLSVAAALALSAAMPGGELVAGRRTSVTPGPAAAGLQGLRTSPWSSPGTLGGTIRTGPFGLYVDEDGEDGASVGRPWTGDEPPDHGDETGRSGSDADVASTLGAGGIPDVALRAYRRAEATLADIDPGCGVSWSVLAAIGRVESNHGRYGGAELREDGSGTRPIRGIPLDGRPGVATIRDTDDGSLDGDRTYDRAVGPMQFIPSTWERVGADGNGDGRADPDDIYDAALSAGLYLCAGGTDVRQPDQLRRAVLRYNHSDEYADTVLALARAYARGETGPLPEPGPAPTRPPVITRPPDDPVSVGPPPALAEAVPPSSGGSGGSSGPGGTGGSSRSGGPGGTGSTSGSGGTGGTGGTGGARPPAGGPSGSATTATTAPPRTGPPTTESPSTRPPATRPPTTRPPSDTPGEPPVTTPTTRPSTTQPPTTRPPTTRPPTTRPPTTRPPTTRPPTTQPPTTQPPTTRPPTTRPPGPVCPRPGGGLPASAHVLSGVVGRDTWSFRVAGDGGALCAEMRLPDAERRVEGAAAEIWASWWVGSASRQHVVWGLVPDEVTAVAVTLADGRVVTARTVPVAAPGVGRAFGVVLPPGAAIAGLEGRRADGTAALRAPDVTGPLAPVAGFDPAVTASVPVAPAGATPPPGGSASAPTAGTTPTTAAAGG